MTDVHHGQLAAAAGDNETIAAAELGAVAAGPREIDPAKVYTVLVPDGARAEILDLDEYLEWPRRASGTYKAATVDSFIAIVGRHDRGEDATTLWVHPTSGKVIAVLNDNGPMAKDHSIPEWGDHRAHLQLIHTDEWTRWLSHDGQLTDQEKFAEHLQDGLTEIAEPDAATLLEIAQTMQGTTSVQWQSGVSLRDGSVHIGYQEEAQARAGKSQDLAIPEEFVLLLSPFIGEDAVQMRARLRWRIRGGHLTIGYKLAQPELIVREALDRVASRLNDEFAGRVYIGEPR